jgi:hypothetical protein
MLQVITKLISKTMSRFGADFWWKSERTLAVNG